MDRLWGLLFLIAIVGVILNSILSKILYFKNEIFIFILIFIGSILIYQIFIHLYFRGKTFKTIKESISEHINNCNDLNHYIGELKCSYVNVSSYDFGQSKMIDSSIYNFKRKEWNKSLISNRIHYCSATVCKNANNQPVKYFCKYFDIKKDEETLSRFENVLNDFSSVEQGKKLLLKERDIILNNISKSIPKIILCFSKNKLWNKLGFDVIDISDLYMPTFTFQYISAGGNSSYSCELKLNINNLNKLINYLNDVIKWKKSIAGQRALMTSKLRETIKIRDGFSCCNCNLSIEDEPNLLLEIDHIIPLSKGGISTENNLQTLCWRCNRTKGAKLETEKRFANTM